VRAERKKKNRGATWGGEGGSVKKDEINPERKNTKVYGTEREV